MAVCATRKSAYGVATDALWLPLIRDHLNFATSLAIVQPSYKPRVVEADEGLESSPLSPEKPPHVDVELTPEVTSAGISSELQTLNNVWGKIDPATRRAILRLATVTAGVESDPGVSN